MRLYLIAVRCVEVIIGGQALSHCVNYTTRDLLRYWTPRDPADLILLLDGKHTNTAKWHVFPLNYRVVSCN